MVGSLGILSLSPEEASGISISLNLTHSSSGLHEILASLSGTLHPTIESIPHPITLQRFRTPFPTITADH